FSSPRTLRRHGQTPNGRSRGNPSTQRRNRRQAARTPHVNLLLPGGADFIGADRAILRDRRLTHLHEVHRADAGDSLRVGRVGGLMGQGRILRLENQEAELQVCFDQPPPPKLPLTLLLALPRPKMLKRVLQTVATLGVPRLILLNSYRVEKSFWQTPFLEPTAIREQLILGLE